MNEITSYQSTQLPDTLEDLTQFVLVGKAKLDAYMLKLRTINKLSVAQGIRDQTLKEAQEVSTALIAAEQRIGELLLAIPSSSGRRTDLETSSTQVEKVKTKTETVNEMGYSKDEVSDYQQMAKNPEIVAKIMNEAIANGDVVTKSQVMKEIAEAKRKAKVEAEEENNRLRFALSESEAKRIKAEQNTKEVVKEVVKEVEVIPDDYDDLKKKAKSAEAWKKDYERQQTKTGEKQQQILELQQQIKDLQEQTIREQSNNDMIASAIMFATQCKNFIESVGGYVFLSEHLMELPEKERKGYQTSAQAVHDWSQIILNNIERKNYELLGSSEESV